jgi:hypothetical protein
VHPARADDDVGPRVELQDKVCERRVVLGTGGGGAGGGLGVFPLERNEVVVGGGDGGFRGALEAVCCFAAVARA